MRLAALPAALLLIAPASSGSGGAPPAPPLASLLRLPLGPSEAGLFISPVRYNHSLLGPAFTPDAPSGWYLTQWSATQQLNASDAVAGPAPGNGPCGAGAGESFQTLWHASAADQLVCVQRSGGGGGAGALALLVLQDGSHLPCGAEFDSFISPTDGAYANPPLKNMVEAPLGGASGVGDSLRARFTLELLAFAPSPRCGPRGSCGPSGQLDYGYLTLGLTLGSSAGETIFYQVALADTRSAPACPGSDTCRQWSDWFSTSEPLGVTDSIAFLDGADGGCLQPGAGARSYDLPVGPRLLAVVAYAAAHFNTSANASAWSLGGVYVGAGMEGSTIAQLRISEVDLVYARGAGAR